MKRGLGLLLIATILWGGNYICGRFLGPSLPATLLNTIRWTISTLILFGILSLNHKRLPLFKEWKKFALLGFTGIFAFSTLNYLALRSISASQAGMISAGTPIAILLFTPFVLKENISRKAWICAFISIFGVIILFQGQNNAAAGGSLLGNIEMVLACLAWGIYTVLGKKFSKEIDPLTQTAGAAFFGTIFSAISCIGTVDADMIQMNLPVILSILYVSTLASVGAYLAWNAGVKIVGASQAAPYINMLPVWTVVFGVILLNEQISLLSGIGGVITIIGAVLATMERGYFRSLFKRHTIEKRI
ncbi:DMT family transporter [Bacillus benzoevorans]|nr:DMT family transporter [Bacillus benzoevorans]